MKSSVLLTAALLCATAANAANIRDLDVGDGVYVKGFLADQQVFVARIDYDNNRVKVRSADDATTQWVSPADIITKEESTGRDVGRLGAGLLIGLCLLSDSCSGRDHHAESDANGSRIKVNNNCSHGVRLALTYDNASGVSSSAGWWDLPANTSYYLTFKDGSSVTTSGEVFYYYAETSDGSLYWGSGEHSFVVGGRTLPMSTATVDRGADSNLTLQCAGN